MTKQKRTSNKLPDWLVVLIAFLILAAMISFWAISRKKAKNPVESSVGGLVIYSDMYLGALVPPYHIETKELGYRIITAYNPVESQTDSEPCITASGMNVCDTKRNIIASNEFAFGTLLMIDGKVWEVQDRTSEKYSHRIDLLMYDYQEALDWGRKNLMVELAY